MNRIEKGLGFGGLSKEEKQTQYNGNLNKLLILGLPEYLPEEGCMELLSPFGTVKYFKLTRNIQTGVSKGRGVVVYEDQASAKSALQHLNGLKMGNCILQVRRLYDNLFDVILHREHCILASDAGFTREGGKPWDTVKPLEKYFQSHHVRVVLIDDSSHKSWPGEEESMVILPTWEDKSIAQGENVGKSTCIVLEKLTDIFLSNRDIDQVSFKDMVEAARREFRDKAILPVEIAVSESESAEILPVFSDRGGETPKSSKSFFSPLHYQLEQFAR